MAHLAVESLLGAFDALLLLRDGAARLGLLRARALELVPVRALLVAQARERLVLPADVLCVRGERLLDVVQLEEEALEDEVVLWGGKS